MIDRYGRKIEYLRLSVTDRCNLNCNYCKRTINEERELISYEEIKKIVSFFSQLGISKIRLTGGEPLLRGDIENIINLCKNTEGILEVALTTNGVLLADKAQALKNAGLDRVNISIDSLDPKKYRKISGVKTLSKVLKGIDEAIKVGLNPVKINVVLMRGVNDDEIDLFIDLAKNRPIEVRFIEYMPMGGEDKNLLLTEKDITKLRPDLVKCESSQNNVANIYCREGFKGKIGFISPISQPFCSTCNRIRVTADCQMRYCLGDNGEIDLREILTNNNEEALAHIKTSILNKPQKGFCKGFITNRGMGNIGG